MVVRGNLISLITHASCTGCSSVASWWSRVRCLQLDVAHSREVRSKWKLTPYFAPRQFHVMPITLNLCNNTPVEFVRGTCVDAGSVNELFVSAAIEETRQAQMKRGSNLGPITQRPPGSNVISQGPTSSDVPTYSETLLAHQLEESNDAEGIYKRSSGLIHALEAAYSNHRHLVLRPDDIWHAMLSQFSIYVNKNSESLRGSFVVHEGQKTYVIPFVSHVAECLTLLFTLKPKGLRLGDNIHC